MVCIYQFLPSQQLGFASRGSDHLSAVGSQSIRWKGRFHDPRLTKLIVSCALVDRVLGTPVVAATSMTVVIWTSTIIIKSKQRLSNLFHLHLQYVTVLFLVEPTLSFRQFQKKPFKRPRESAGLGHVSFLFSPAMYARYQFVSIVVQEHC